MNGRSEINLTNFNDPYDVNLWRITNDAVMGGRSIGHFEVCDSNYGVFSGELSLENNGGFTSVFRPWPHQLRNKCKILIDVLGDGKVYQLRLRTKGIVSGFAYKFDFKSDSNGYTNLEVYPENFIATFRGRDVTDAAPISFDDIDEIGFLIANKQRGRFKLVIKSMKAELF